MAAAVTPRPLPLLPFVEPTRGRPLLAVSIPVEPLACPRPRAQARLMWKGGKQVPVAHVHDRDELTGYHAAVVEMFTNAGLERIETWCIVQCIHVATRPPELPRFVHVRKVKVACPQFADDERAWATYDKDLDNLVKATLDAVVHAGVLLDDRLVVEDGGSRKLYGRVGEEPCVEVRIWRA